MSRFFHERNPERLVHYEGCVHDRRYSDITDMESRMYAKPDEIREYLESRPQKPYISCEYMHAMGNSCGGMEKYTKLEYDYEQYQGGFIWDFADQAILTREMSGPMRSFLILHREASSSRLAEISRRDLAIIISAETG